MSKKKSLFVTFEGIEGSGKTYQSKKLFRKIKSMGLPAIYTREPGGTKAAEKIREVILQDYFHPDSKEKFNKYTDTLLYLAARNEHIEKKLKPAIFKKKIIICDRFIDSTLVNKSLVDSVHKYILGSIKPDLTFILKANISKAMQRLKKRKKKNRYDKFSKNFYDKVQKAFLKIAKTDKKKYIIIDNSLDTPETEKIIFKKFIKVFNK